jgi:3,4-dihydroxy 2-butanone 4-phosphate synthase / GTP cyclohydrolase II
MAGKRPSPLARAKGGLGGHEDRPRACPCASAGDRGGCALERIPAARLPTALGEFRITAFGCPLDTDEHVALIVGDVYGGEEVLVRIHSECLTGDVFGSRRCDCGEQLDVAMRHIADEGRGVLLYLRQEGRGIGLVNKLRAYALQEAGANTVEANELLGFPADVRGYRCAACMIRALGIRSVRLMTNNPAKIEDLERNGIVISRREPIEIMANAANRAYLETKRDEMRHILRAVGRDPVSPARHTDAAGSDPAQPRPY